MKRKMKKLGLSRETVRVLGTGSLRGVWAGGDDVIEVRETKTTRDTEYFSCSYVCPDTQYFSCSLACPPSKTVG